MGELKSKDHQLTLKDHSWNREIVKSWSQRCNWLLSTKVGCRRLEVYMLAFVSLWRSRGSARSFVGGANFGGLGLWPNPIRRVVFLKMSIRAECNASSLYNFTSYFPARIPLYWFYGIPFLSMVTALVYHVPVRVYNVTSCGLKNVFFFMSSLMKICTQSFFCSWPL
jgi:hypothetical protein